jgi:hypothetical protein
VPGAQTRRSSGGRADTSSTKPTAGDSEDRRRRRDRDAPLEDAYNAGVAGDDPAPHRLSDDTWQQYRDGRRAGRSQRRRESVGGAVSQATTKGVSVAKDGAGFVLGAIAFALFSAYLDGGSKRARKWIAAKFINLEDPA